MRQLGIVLVFGLGVGVGCAAGTAVQTRVAQADAGAGASSTAPPRWEVHCEHFDSLKHMNERGSRLGAEWWEPFAAERGTTASYICFKRPLP